MSHEPLLTEDVQLRQVESDIEVRMRQEQEDAGGTDHRFPESILRLPMRALLMTLEFLLLRVRCLSFFVVIWTSYLAESRFIFEHYELARPKYLECRTYKRPTIQDGVLHTYPTIMPWVGYIKI